MPHCPLLDRVLPTALLMTTLLSMPAGALAQESTAAPASGPELREALRRGVAEIFAAGAAPGMSIAVVVDTGVLYLDALGFADVAAGRRATPETRFYIASSTKSFTALAAALLDRDGVISLDAPVSRYLPELELQAPLSPDSITLRELLTHTHGIANDGPVVARTAFTGVHDPALLVRLMREHAPDERGGAFRYGNIGYNLASFALDRATGRSWKDVLAERVLGPAGMRHTTGYVSRVAAEDLAMPYVIADTGFERVHYAKVDGNMHAAGGLVSTAADMARWLEVNINDGLLDGRRVFPAEIMHEVHRTQVRHGDSLERWPRHGYGLGWQVGTWAGDTLLHHFGGFSGFDAHVSFMPARRAGVAVLVNGARGGTLMDIVSQYVYDVLAGRVEPGARARELRGMIEQGMQEVQGRIATNRAERRARQDQALAHPLSAFTGTFEHPGFGRMEWRLEDGRLHAQLGAMESEAEIFDATENALRVELIPGSGSVARWTFEGDRAVRVKWNGITFERVAD